MNNPIPEYTFNKHGSLYSPAELKRMMPGILQLHISQAARYVNASCYNLCKYSSAEIPGATVQDYENARLQIRIRKYPTSAIGNMAFCALYHPNPKIAETWFNCFTMLQKNI